ncbi:hypothetical protein [Nocardioides sp. LHG3406-4]|uniref:hypothetical protein n=1 Tax=Nocardioides sp. LHG3406-4 TaxID=2804575 RepID=UPI003CF3F2A9
MSEPPPERVRVTGPARRRTHPRRAGTGEIDAGTRVGAIYMGSLLREQGWLAVRILTLLAVTVGSLPLAFHLFPALAGVRLVGIPLSWLLIGFLVYPWLVVLGWRYVGAAEANERDFAALVEEIER